MKKLKILSVLTIIAAVFLSLCSCGGKAPALDDIKDELVSVIDKSAEVNLVLFGEGVPVYSRDDEENYNIYNGMTEGLSSYELVRDESPYQTTEELKKLAESVYAPDYIDPISEILFVGYADEDVGVTAAKFYEWDGRLYRNMNFKNYVTSVRTFDYDTMKIVKPSKAKYINVSLESTLDGEKSTVTLAFILTADGWRLDTPTY